VREKAEADDCVERERERERERKEEQTVPEVDSEVVTFGLVL
jgi:hypothetical protein